MFMNTLEDFSKKLILPEVKPVDPQEIEALHPTLKEFLASDDKQTIFKTQCIEYLLQIVTSPNSSCLPKIHSLFLQQTLLLTEEITLHLYKIQSHQIDMKLY